MAASDRELVEAAYRTWNASGPRAFVEHTTADVELHDAPELPDAQVWAGRDAVVSRLEDVVASTGAGWARIDGVRFVADEVLVSLTWGLDPERPETSTQVFHLVRPEAGRIARIRVFLDEAAALRAAASG